MLLGSWFRDCGGSSRAESALCFICHAHGRQERLIPGAVWCAPRNPLKCEIWTTASMAQRLVGTTVLSMGKVFVQQKVPTAGLGMKRCLPVWACGRGAGVLLHLKNHSYLRQRFTTNAVMQMRSRPYPCSFTLQFYPFCTGT